MGQTWGRAFAVLYDPLMSLADGAGLAEERRLAVADARGRVLELGAGTGRNVPLYGPQVTHLTLSEPEEPMARRLRARAGSTPMATEIVECAAEALPFADDAFDTVVSTLVLCTVTDVDLTLAEIRRVLAPGGRLVFLEHVRADGALANWQDRLHGPWLAFGHGCHCNRDTLGALGSAGFDVENVARGTIKRLGPLVRPLVRGTATPV